MLIQPELRSLPALQDVSEDIPYVPGNLDIDLDDYKFAVNVPGNLVSQFPVIENVPSSLSNFANFDKDLETSKLNGLANVGAIVDASSIWRFNETEIRAPRLPVEVRQIHQQHDQSIPNAIRFARSDRVSSPYTSDYAGPSQVLAQLVSLAMARGDASLSDVLALEAIHGRHDIAEKLYVESTRHGRLISRLQGFIGKRRPRIEDSNVISLDHEFSSILIALDQGLWSVQSRGRSLEEFREVIIINIEILECLLELLQEVSKVSDEQITSAVYKFASKRAAMNQGTRETLLRIFCNITLPELSILSLRIGLNGLAKDSNRTLDQPPDVHSNESRQRIHHAISPLPEYITPELARMIGQIEAHLNILASTPSDSYFDAMEKIHENGLALTWRMPQRQNISDSVIRSEGKRNVSNSARNILGQAQSKDEDRELVENESPSSMKKKFCGYQDNSQAVNKARMDYAFLILSNNEAYDLDNTNQHLSISQLPEICLRPIFLQQARIVSRVCLRVVKKTYNVKYHLDALQRYMFLADGEFATGLVHALWDYSNRPRHPVTPRKSSLASELTHLLESSVSHTPLGEYGSPQITFQDASSDGKGTNDHADRVLDTISRIGLRYSIPRALMDIIHPESLDQYNLIFRNVLWIKQALFSAQRVLHKCKSSSWQSISENSSLTNKCLNNIIKFHIEAHQFVSNIHDYFVSAIAQHYRRFHAALEEICTEDVVSGDFDNGLRSDNDQELCKDPILELRNQHDSYLTDCSLALLCGPNQTSGSNALREVILFVLQRSYDWQNLQSSATHDFDYDEDALGTLRDKINKFMGVCKEIIRENITNRSQGQVYGDDLFLCDIHTGYGADMLQQLDEMFWISGTTT